MPRALLYGYPRAPEASRWAGQPLEKLAAASKTNTPRIVGRPTCLPASADEHRNFRRARGRRRAIIDERGVVVFKVPL
jgi:hypothetical protein